MVLNLLGVINSFENFFRAMDSLPGKNEFSHKIFHTFRDSWTLWSSPVVLHMVVDDILDKSKGLFNCYVLWVFLYQVRKTRQKENDLRIRRGYLWYFPVDCADKDFPSPRTHTLSQVPEMRSAFWSYQLAGRHTEREGLPGTDNGARLLAIASPVCEKARVNP